MRTFVVIAAGMLCGAAPAAPVAACQEAPAPDPAAVMAGHVEQLGAVDREARLAAAAALRPLGRAPLSALAEAWIAGATGSAGAVPEIREFTDARRRQHAAWELIVDFFPGLAFSRPSSIKPDILRGYVKSAPGRDTLNGLPPDVALWLRTGGKGLADALRAAAAIRGPLAVNAIRPWMSTGSPADRIAACHAAIRVGDAMLRAQAETLLREWATADVALDLRLGVAEGLAMLGAAAAVPICAEGLQAADELIRVRAARILALLGPLDVGRAVSAWLEGADPRLAALAAGILIQIGDAERGRAWLDRALASSDPAVSGAAAKVSISLAKGVTTAQQAQVFDQQVADAVARGLRFLRTTQRGDGTWESLITVVPERGVTALAMLALIKSGVPTDDEAVLRALSSLRLPGDAAGGLGVVRAYEQYVWSVEIMALAAMQAPDFRDLIASRAQALLSRRRSGVWDYYEGGDGGTGPRKGDLSMTQMALLGLREAANAGVPVPAAVWRQAAAWITKVQFRDGGWVCEPVWSAEQAGERVHLLVSDTGMTAAAVGSLMVCREQLGKRLKRAEAEAIQAAVDRGIERLGNIFAVRPESKVAGHQSGYHFYYLYGIERAGALTRRTAFGGRDWYHEGAGYIVSAQRADGGWVPGDAIGTLPAEHRGKSSALQTAFALLFLDRATRPILTRGRSTETTPPSTPPPPPTPPTPPPDDGGEKR